MKASKFLLENGHVKIVNNHARFDLKPDTRPFCAECWKSKGGLVQAPFDQVRNAWVCPDGHEGRNDGYPASTTV